MPARVGTSGRSAQRQCEGTKRQPLQRSPLGPPRARKGLTLRARRVERRRATAWALESAKFEKACKGIFTHFKMRHLWLQCLCII